MDFVLIFGDSAVGKMTVGKALMERTGLRLFHNHMMIEPVLEIFGEFHLPAIEKTREVIFDEFLKTNQQGLIFTFMWAFSEPDDWDYVQALHDKFTSQGATCYYVELVTDEGTRFERNKTALRLKEKASKRIYEATGDSDLADCVYEDFAILSDGMQLGYKDVWFTKMFESYAAAVIPSGEL